MVLLDLLIELLVGLLGLGHVGSVLGKGKRTIGVHGMGRRLGRRARQDVEAGVRIGHVVDLGKTKKMQIFSIPHECPAVPCAI